MKTNDKNRKSNGTPGNSERNTGTKTNRPRTTGKNRENQKPENKDQRKDTDAPWKDPDPTIPERRNDPYAKDNSEVTNKSTTETNQKYGANPKEKITNAPDNTLTGEENTVDENSDDEDADQNIGTNPAEADNNEQTRQTPKGDPKSESQDTKDTTM
jgi:hypothetical protein